MRAVNQYDKDWNFVKRYLSIRDAAKQTGVNAGNICVCCKGRIDKAGGYHWVYAYKVKMHLILSKLRKTDFKAL